MLWANEQIISPYPIFVAKASFSEFLPFVTIRVLTDPTMFPGDGYWGTEEEICPLPSPRLPVEGLSDSTDPQEISVLENEF